MIKRLFSKVGEYKKNAILTPIFVSMEVILEVILPMLTAVLVNIVDIFSKDDVTKAINEATGITRFFIDKFGTTKEGLTTTIIVVGIMVVITAFLSLICGYIAGKNCAIASAGFAKNIRKAQFEQIQNFSFSNIDKFSKASLLTRLSSDIYFVRMAFQMVIRTAIRSPLMLIFSLVATALICPQVLPVFAVVVPLLMIALFGITTIVHPLFVKVFTEYDELNQVVEENVRGIRVVKSFVNEDSENKKFNKVSDRIYKLFIKAEKIIAYNRPLFQLSVYSTLIFISIIGARMIWAETGLEVGELSTVITYSALILNSLSMLSMIYVNIIIAIPSMERINEVLLEKPSITNPENPITKIEDGSIEFKNVSFSYSGNKEKLALKNANLDIKSGQVIGIIGGTGSAKSTLVQLIPRLYDATEGEVFVSGHNVKEYDLKVLRDNVSMVLQKNVLFSGTIKENMRWGNENATDEEIQNACKIAQADEFIQNFPNKYDTHIEQGGTNVSGGQRQRLCIARAILKSPKILILDDSTSAVDTKTDALIRNEFKVLLPDVTKIIISQRVASIEDADQIIIMDNGNIVDIGKSEELLERNAIYQEIYEQQKGGK